MRRALHKFFLSRHQKPVTTINPRQNNAAAAVCTHFKVLSTFVAGIFKKVIVFATQNSTNNRLKGTYTKTQPPADIMGATLVMCTLQRLKKMMLYSDAYNI